MRRFRITALLGALIVLSASYLTVLAQAQPQNDDFPAVVTTEIVDCFCAGMLGIDVRIANDARYIFLGRDIWERGTPKQALKPVGGSYPFVAGWSLNSSYVAVANKAGICTDYPELQSTLYVREVATGKITRLCLPLRQGTYALNWTPFSETDLLVRQGGDGFWLLDWTTQKLKPVDVSAGMSADATLAAMQQPYTGLDNLLWSNDKHAFIGEVRIQPQTPPRLLICPPMWLSGDQCKTLLEISNYKNITVFPGAKLSVADHFVMWAGNDTNGSPSAAAVATQAATQSTQPMTPDTVIFLTNLDTSQTKEIFRLSSLKQPDLTAEKSFDWSSDGKTIALNLRKPGKDSSTNPAGTLLITLQWPNGK